MSGTKKIMTNLKWINSQLLATGMSQKDLSERIGLDPGAMSRTIAGRRRLQISEANKIARLFGTTLIEVLENFGIADHGAATETVTILMAAGKGGLLSSLPGKDTVPSLPSFPDAKCAVQWREPGSEFDGWLFYISNVNSDIEVGRFAVIQVEGKSYLGVAQKSYVPGRFKITPQAGESFEAAIIGMRPVLAIIPV